MFGIGFAEIIIIILAIIVFIRPEDFPAFVRKIGKIFGQAKKAYNDVVSVKDQFVKELENAADELNKDVPTPEGVKKDLLTLAPPTEQISKPENKIDNKNEDNVKDESAKKT